MINVYAENNYDTQGIKILKPLRATVREEINGEFSLDADFSEHDAEFLQEGYVLKADTPRGKQLFRISEVSSFLDDGVAVYAPHITNDLGDFFIEDTNVVLKDGDDAINQILANTLDSHDFTGESDITTVTNTRLVRTSALASILNAKANNSFVNRWGGEIERDNLHIKMLSQIGSDNGYRIKYRRNLTGLRAIRNLSSVVTRIMPTGLYENDTVLQLAEKYVESPLIGNYPNPKTRHLHFSDIKIDPDGTYPTLADARAELLSRAQALFELGADLPQVTINVDFIELSKTVEYKQFEGLESVNLGDVVRVKHEPLDLDLTLRVVSYEYDSAHSRYSRLTIGEKAPNIGQSMIDTNVDLSALRQIVDEDTLKQSGRYDNVRITADEGFVAENETLNSKAVLNSDKIGFYDMDTDEFLGGLANVNGVVSMISKILANQENPSAWAEIGETTISGSLVQGLFLYKSSISDSIPSARITINGAGDILLLDKNSNLRFSAETLITRLYDGNGQIRFYADGNTTRLIDGNGQARFYADGNTTSIIDALNKARFGAETSQTFIRSAGENDTYIVVDPNYISFYVNGTLKETWS